MALFANLHIKVCISQPIHVQIHVQMYIASTQGGWTNRTNKPTEQAKEQDLEELTKQMDRKGGEELTELKSEKWGNNLQAKRLNKLCSKIYLKMWQPDRYTHAHIALYIHKFWTQKHIKMAYIYGDISV